MQIILLHRPIAEWDGIPIKFKEIVLDVGYMVRRHCQEYLTIELIESSNSDYVFYFRKFPKAGSNGIIRIVEILNDIYQFDPNRETIPFAEESNSGFLIRCNWKTHSLNKVYRKEAML
ncbi:MAG TPA: hypothetical protein PLO52_00500 [Flavobacterium alvei]|nr:hypothetical protein [Flavobacterium alvei]